MFQRRAIGTRRERVSARAGDGRKRIGRVVRPLGGRFTAGRSLRSRFWDVRSRERFLSAVMVVQTGLPLQGADIALWNTVSVIRSSGPLR